MATAPEQKVQDPAAQVEQATREIQQAWEQLRASGQPMENYVKTYTGMDKLPRGGFAPSKGFPGDDRYTIVFEPQRRRDNGKPEEEGSGVMTKVIDLEREAMKAFRDGSFKALKTERQHVELRGLQYQASAVKNVLREIQVMKEVKPLKGTVSYLMHYTDGKIVAIAIMDGGVSLNRETGPLGRFKDPAARKLMAPRWMRQIFTTLANMHKAGIGHYDLHPDNVLVDRRDPDKIRIIDFGLSVQGRVNNRESIRNWNVRIACPEMYNLDAMITFKADIWAAGLLWFGLVATAPHPMTTRQGGMTKLYVEHQCDMAAVHAAYFASGRLMSGFSDAERGTQWLPMMARCLSLLPSERPFAEEVADVDILMQAYRDTLMDKGISDPSVESSGQAYLRAPAVQTARYEEEEVPWGGSADEGAEDPLDLRDRYPELRGMPVFVNHERLLEERRTLRRQLANVAKLVRRARRALAGV